MMEIERLKSLQLEDKREEQRKQAAIDGKNVLMQ